MNTQEKIVGINPHTASKTSHRRRRIGMRKRTAVSIFAVLFIALALTASAALLTYYGKVETTATVSQSILVDGNDWTNPVLDSFDVTGGCTVCKYHWIRNNACIDGTVSLDTVISSPGVTVTYKDSVHLENKDPSGWTIISGDDTEADVTFEIVGEEFAYTLEATGLQIDAEYVLIYYADFDERFNQWGGNNPGALLGTFTADSDGAISGGNSVDIGMNMPHINDWNNAPPADYTQSPDSYDHKTGAKLWLVPSTDYVEGELTVWNPTTYLFETELIRYFGNDVNEITIPAGEFIDFLICYEFAIDINPGNYIITTDVIPVVV